MKSCDRVRTCYTHFPFAVGEAIQGRLAGGIEAVIQDEVRRRSSSTTRDLLKIVSEDQKPIMLPEAAVEIKPVGSSPLPFEEHERSFFNRDWVVMHPDAFLMAPGEIYTSVFGEPISGDVTNEHLASYVDGIDKDLRVLDTTRKHVDRYINVMKIVNPGDTVNYGSNVFLDVMARYGSELRRNEVFQTYHHHFPFPLGSVEFKRGRQMLEAMALMDRVYLHTDSDIRAFEIALQRCGISFSGQLRRFDLGINTFALDHGLESVTPNNYQDLPEFRALGDDQRRTIQEAFKTRGKVPNRFLSVDRVDPIKGTHIALEAVERYLDSLDMSLDKMQSKFRFFFVHQLFFIEDYDPKNLKHQYIKMVKKMYDRIQSKYPGIIFVSNSIPKLFIPSLMEGCHYLCASPQEGLNLASMEALYVADQTNEDTTAIVSNGTGFAKQTIETGHGTNLLAVRKGNIDDFSTAIRTTVDERPDNPGLFRKMTGDLVRQVVLRRNDSVIVTR